MKILHVFDHSLPLHSGYTYRSRAIVRAQRARGWDTVHLTTPRHAQDAGPPAGEAEEVDGLTFWRTPMAPTALARTPAWPLAEMRATTAVLRRLAQRERPDVLHAHSPALNAHPAIRVGRELGIPVVYEVRGFWEDAAVDHGTAREGGLRYRLTRALETRALHRADHVTTICDGLRGEMATRGIAAERITLIPNAVDAERFVPVARAGAEPGGLREQLGLGGAFVIGFVGSFYAYEGLDLLIRALPAIRAAVPTAKLLLVGGGPADADLRRLVGELGLADQVAFTGRVPNAAVHDYYALVDALVFPRKRMRLTELVTPLKPLEAMAQSLPVVASDVGGHRELIRDGDTGLLFAADDTEALAARVAALHADPALAARLRQRGREHVLAERTWARSAQAYEKVYADAAAAAQRRRRA